MRLLYFVALFARVCVLVFLCGALVVFGLWLSDFGTASVPDNPYQSRPLRRMPAGEAAMTIEQRCAARAERGFPCPADRPRPDRAPLSAWYEGGTLGTATGRQWREASQRDRLATASDLVTTYLNVAHDGAGTEIIRSVIASTGELGRSSRVHRNAAALVGCLDSTFVQPDPFVDGLAVTMASIGCLALGVDEGWILVR